MTDFLIVTASLLARPDLVAAGLECLARLLFAKRKSPPVFVIVDRQSRASPARLRIGRRAPHFRKKARKKGHRFRAPEIDPSSGVPKVQRIRRGGEGLPNEQPLT